MPIVRLSKEDTSYCLIAHDADGRERTDDPDGLMSERIVEEITNRRDPITDVFIISHGWKGDVPAARDQYSNWIGAMSDCKSDVERIGWARKDFAHLVVGFHWPSLPFGDEELGSSGPAFAGQSTNALPLDELVERYAQRLIDTPKAREAIQLIVNAALAGAAPLELPDEIRAAYKALDQEMNLQAAGVAAAPGADREPFDPDRAYKARGALVRPTYGGSGLGEGLLAPLRQMSFWAMKDRARRIGETAGASMLRRIQDATTLLGETRFHLIGHSFGCIVVSAMLRGADESKEIPKPVHSLSLMQGALSLWSFAADVPDTEGQPGYFHRIITDKMVRGAIVTTQSRYDTAVGKLYPLAAGVAGQVTFVPGAFPKYGAVGAFGARGSGLVCIDQSMLPRDQPYQFSSGKVYNINASAYVCEGTGLSGAHSDIARPEVAHAVWEAVGSAP